MKVIKVIVLFLSFIAACGCAQINVKKLSATSNNDATTGQRFSLPKPFLQVTPQPDGSVVVDVVYLPDPGHTYAVNTCNFLSDVTLDVTTADGVITKAVWTGDSSAVVAQGVQSAGNSLGTVLQAQQKQQSDQTATVQSARQGVASASLALHQAQADLVIVLANDPSASDQARAREAVSDATLKLQDAENTLNGLLGQSGSSNPTADAPSAKTLFGPMLFAIDERLTIDDDSQGATARPYLSVIPVSQNMVDPSKPPPTNPPTGVLQPSYPVTTQPVRATSPDFFPKGTASVSPDNAGNMALDILPSVPLFSIGAPTFARMNSTSKKYEPYDAPNPLPDVALQSAALIHVNLRGLAAGKYLMILPYQLQNGGKMTAEAASPRFDFEILK